MAEPVELQVSELSLVYITAMADVVDHEVLVGIPVCQDSGFRFVVAPICGCECDRIHDVLQKRGPKPPRLVEVAPTDDLVRPCRFDYTQDILTWVLIHPREGGRLLPGFVLAGLVAPLHDGAIDHDVSP